MVNHAVPYEDLIIETSDDKEVKWIETECHYKMGCLLSMTTSSFSNGRCLHINVPLAENTVNCLKSWAEFQTFPPCSWIDMELLLLDLEHYSYPLILNIKESIIDKFVGNLKKDNCIGIWRMCNRMRSKSTEKALRFVLENLLIAVHKKTIDISFFRLSEEQLCGLLSNEKLYIMEELDVVLIIQAWIGAQPGNRASRLKDMLSVVRRCGIPDFVTEIAGIPIAELCLSKQLNRIASSMALIIGGWETGPLNDMLLLDQVNCKWTRLNRRLPYVTAYHGAVILDGELYLFGGGDDTSVHYSNSMKFTKAGVWVNLAPMRQQRCYISNTCVVLNGFVWVMGGHTGGSSRARLRSVERYNPQINMWETMPSMIHMRSDAAAAVVNGKIFVIGGFDGREITASTEMFDPQIGVWTEFTRLPAPRAGLGCVFTANEIILLGGFDGVNRHNTVWTMDVTTQNPQWILLPMMIQPRSNFSACWIGDKILVAGGYCERTVNKAEMFDGNRWVEVTSLPAGRSALKLVAINQADVFRFQDMTAGH